MHKPFVIWQHWGHLSLRKSFKQNSWRKQIPQPQSAGLLHELAVWLYQSRSHPTGEGADSFQMQQSCFNSPLASIKFKSSHLAVLSCFQCRLFVYLLLFKQNVTFTLKSTRLFNHVQWSHSTLSLLFQSIMSFSFSSTMYFKLVGLTLHVWTDHHIHPPTNWTPCPLFQVHSWVSPCSRHLLVKPRSQHITVITLHDTHHLSIISSQSIHRLAANADTLESVNNNLNIHSNVLNTQN